MELSDQFQSPAALLSRRETRLTVHRAVGLGVVVNRNIPASARNRIHIIQSLEREDDRALGRM
jgi:hypothetical protein